MKRWFNYVGKDTTGNRVEGVLGAVNHQEAEAELSGKGIEPWRLYELDWVKCLEDSLQCYVCGWLSFLPFVGLMAAVRAMRLFGRVRMQVGGEWNPAGGYLLCGYALAWLGCLFSIILSIGLVLILVRAMLGAD